MIRLLKNAKDVKKDVTNVVMVLAKVLRRMKVEAMEASRR